MSSKREAAYFVTKSNGFEKGSEVLGLPCHKEYWFRKEKPTTWYTLSQKVMGSKKEAKYLAYFVRKSNDISLQFGVFGLLCR